jgi:hypothetical protein
VSFFPAAAIFMDIRRTLAIQFAASYGFSKFEEAMPTIERDAYRDRRYAEWYLVLGVVLLIAAGAAGWKVSKLWTAPSTEEAMRRSFAQLRRPEVAIAYALHPDMCTITTTMWKWSVMCEGVPTHFYQDLTVCDPGPPKTCGPVPSDYEDCRSFYWDIDLDGKPSDPIGDRQHYASMADRCRLKGTLTSDREEMAKRGFTPERVEILDYAGRYTGRPRPIGRPKKE